MTLWSIKNRLSKMSRRAAPDRGFVLSLHNKLQEAGYLAKPKFTLWKLSWKRMAVSFALLLSVGVGATATYAYESPDVLPDHPLYGLRTTLEKIELTVQSTSEGKENVRLKQLVRHLRDTRTLAIGEKPQVTEQTNVVLNDLADAMKDEPATSAEAISEQEEYLRASVELDHQELKDIVDDQKAVRDEAAQPEDLSPDTDADPIVIKQEKQIVSEDKKRVSQALVEAVDRASQHVKALRDHQREERAHPANPDQNEQE